MSEEGVLEMTKLLFKQETISPELLEFTVQIDKLIKKRKKTKSKRIKKKYDKKINELTYGKNFILYKGG